MWRNLASGPTPAVIVMVILFDGMECWDLRHIVLGLLIFTYDELNRICIRLRNANETLCEQFKIQLEKSTAIFFCGLTK